VPAKQRRFPRSWSPVLFGFVLSGLNTLVVTAITTYRNLGLDNDFVGDWLGAFVAAWPITFPTATLIAPWVRRLVDRLVEPASQQPITTPSPPPL
jgi:hypothetical protein